MAVYKHTRAFKSSANNVINSEIWTIMTYYTVLSTISWYRTLKPRAHTYVAIRLVFQYEQCYLDLVLSTNLSCVHKITKEKLNKYAIVNQALKVEQSTIWIDSIYYEAMMGTRAK